MSLLGSKKRLSQICNLGRRFEGRQRDWINFGRNGCAGAELRMVPQVDVPELLPVNAENEYTFQASARRFPRIVSLMATRIV